jgi:hypothetical protein
MTERELDAVRTDLARVRSSKSRKQVQLPTQSLGDMLDQLAEHIAYEHRAGSTAKAEQLAAVRDQLSTIRARWNCP